MYHPGADGKSTIVLLEIPVALQCRILFQTFLLGGFLSDADNDKAIILLCSFFSVYLVYIVLPGLDRD